MTKMLTHFIFLFLTLTSPRAYAQSEVNVAPLFGVELTFTNPDIMAEAQLEFEPGVHKFTNLKISVKSRWLEIIHRKCPECTVQSDGRVDHPLGFHIKIGSDPWVLEVNASPMSIKKLKEHRALLQDLIWDSAKEAGVTPHYRVGGGHLHLDRKSHFGGDTRLLRDFTVDMINNSELFMGGFSLDILNAPPFTSLQRADEMLIENLRDYDDSDPQHRRSFRGVMNEVYDSADHPESMRGRKYQVLNFDHADTVEVRGLRPQESIDHLILMAEILSGRIDKLKAEFDPVPLKLVNHPRPFKSKGEDGIQKYEVLVSAEQILKVTRAYVEEAGIEFSRYEPYLPIELRHRLRPVSLGLSCGSFL